MYGVRREAWNTGCILQCGGSLSRYTRFESLLVIGKGPNRFGESFAGFPGILILVASSQTICPSLNGLKFRLWCADIFCLASSCAASASFRTWFKLWSRSERVGVFDNSDKLSGMAVGLYPRMILNGDCPWVECGAELCANSSAVRWLVHSFGVLVQ